ncbi:hypothetical protein RU86_GL000808 [Lactococcus piscium]|uniref:Uncharacterized protein n=1 Tax=Pseudolactococcus piscium TaxID=1364 RepID=A0A2A5RW10_9LACT|nr:hypothetical protein [Lactococcus piscium]PCS05429.1 hypothetical protein RU86_GL000808 [Lactococcus piscium]
MIRLILDSFAHFARNRALRTPIEKCYAESSMRGCHIGLAEWIWVLVAINCGVILSIQNNKQ